MCSVRASAPIHSPKSRRPRPPQEDWSCLHILVNNYAAGKANAIEAVLEAAGASTEATRGASMTPFLMACGTAHSQAINVLIEHRANIMATSSEGTTALDMVWHNHWLAEKLQKLHVPRGEGVSGKGRRPL